MSTTSKTKVEIDTKTFIRFWLVILGFAAAGYIIFQALGGILIVFAALFFAIAISPLVNKLVDIIPGNGRKLPIAISYFIVVGFIVAFIAIVVPSLIEESINFVSHLPSMTEQITSSFPSIDDFGKNIGIQNLSEQFGSFISDWSSHFISDLSTNLFTTVGNLISFFSSVILALILALFMLIEGPDIMDHFWTKYQNKNTPNIRRIVNRMAGTIAKYVSSAITVGLINACCTIITTLIISLCFGLSPDLVLPFGLITGVMSLIPMFGSFIGGCIVALFLAFNSLPAGIIFITYTIIYLQIESNIISPKIQGKGLDLPALVILASVTIGVYTFGLIGAIIAIPIAGCIKILLEEYNRIQKAEETKDIELKPHGKLVAVKEKSEEKLA